MSKRIARFEIISEENYNEITKRNGFDQVVKYEDIKKPIRSTKGSAGYDFYLTKDIYLRPGDSTIVYTFIRCFIDSDWMLLLIPKSGLGFKYNMTLSNTIGLIDSDYYYTKTDNDTNEGQIMVKICNKGNKDICLHKGEKFCQGVFVQYGVTIDDNADGIRNGAFGSTGSN
jgi:dUTP pyrophosphatase